ncbi:MAG: response regulator transcription factor [Thermomicrobiales bacterium]
MRVLFLEDDETLRTMVERGLTEAGYAVDAFDRGADALLANRTVPYDVAVLDVNLPDMSGFDVYRQMRALPSPPPTLFLTARDGIEDRVAGLDLGAEDYLVKPFAFPELLARMRVLLRRGAAAPPVLTSGDLALDPAAHTVQRAGQNIQLTAREFALLEYLMRNAGQVLTKQMIADHVWNFDLDAESNFIEVYIYTLRKKLDIPGSQPIIQTLRGVGYRLDALRLSELPIRTRIALWIAGISTALLTLWR